MFGVWVCAEVCGGVGADGWWVELRIKGSGWLMLGVYVLEEWVGVWVWRGESVSGVKWS